MRKYLLLIPLLLFAGDRYGIRGKVLDNNTGKPIANAYVNVVGTKLNTETNLDGGYNMWIPPGTYSYSFYATADGYDTLMYTNIHIRYNIEDHSCITYLDFYLRFLADSFINHLIDPSQLNEYGTLIGEVTGEITSKHLRGVAITLERTVNLRQNYRIKTIMHKNAHDNGEYIFLNVPVGEYELTAEMKEYNSFIHDKIVIAFDDVTTFNFSMSHCDTTGGDIPTDDKLQCVVSTEKQTYYLGDSIIIYCTIKNNTDEPIYLCKFSDCGSIVINTGAIVHGDNISLKPERDDFVIITKENPFVREFNYGSLGPGSHEYSISFVFQQTGSEYGFNAWTGSLKSNTINFEVKAR